MRSYIGIESIREAAEKTIEQLGLLAEVLEIDCPGEFLFSPPDSSRLIVRTMEELHAARVALREKYGWNDRMSNKFFSCGKVIVVFSPPGSVSLPFHFDLWVEDSPETFPADLLGECKLQIVPRTEYTITCPVQSEEKGAVQA